MVLSTRLYEMENSMSTSKSQATICLPAHVLEADISPRAREVLMLLASQTTADNPTLWVCHSAITERLRCSPVTVKRAIQKLVEAKLIVETGDLHERRFKFYRVKWSLSENAVSSCVARLPERKNVVTPACAGMTKKESLKPTAPIPPPHPGVDNLAMLKDSRIAYWAEVARQKHEENLRRYRMEVEILNQTNPGEFGERTYIHEGPSQS